MEFSVLNSSGLARRGKLHFKNKNVELETPNCTLYTRIGCVPHLTKGMLLRVNNLPKVLQYSLANFAEHYLAIKQYGKKLTGFTSMDEFVSVVRLHDTSAPVVSGHNTKNGTAVWGKKGKLMLNKSNFMDMQEAFQPDIYVSLHDNDSVKNASLKRTRKAVDRSVDFLEQIIAQHKKSSVLKDSVIIAPLVGGYNVEERKKSALQTLEKHDDVSAYSIEGFECGRSVEQTPFCDVKDLIMTSLTNVKRDKPFILPGALNPLSILEAVSLGVDVFESVYPYIVTERGCASIFTFCDEKSNCKENSNKDIENGCGDNTESLKTEEVFEINLKDEVHQDQFVPLLDGCECYTCKHHTRAYINHLLNTGELLAGTLLMVHNLQHYLSFFSAIRDAIDNGCIEDMTSHIARQLEQCPIKPSTEGENGNKDKTQVLKNEDAHEDTTM